MGFWALVVPHDRYADERLFHHQVLDDLDSGDGRTGPGVDEDVVLLVDGSPRMIFGTGRVLTERPLRVGYTRRAFDQPVPVGDLLDEAGPVVSLDRKRYADLADRLVTPSRTAIKSWLVSVDLPIEAATAAEAVREFWTYVTQLGPRELPAFVAPMGRELAMQTFVLGQPANQDPEEDE